MSYRFIEHTADVAVEVEAYSLEDLFSISCHAWRDAALQSDDINSTDERKIFLTALSYEELLVQLLSELNFFLYTNKWVFNSVKKLRLIEEEESLKLFAEVLGNPLDENIHHLKEEIKAVTFHQMKIVKKEGNFSTRVVFDI
ncbi:MAG: archease [Bacteroidota bacterium]